MRFMMQKLGLQPWYKLVNRRQRRMEDEEGAAQPQVPLAPQQPVAEVAAADVAAATAAAVVPVAAAVEP